MKVMKIKLLLMTIIFLCLASCSQFKDDKNYLDTEFEKEFDGSWKISKITRNGLNLSAEVFDFTKFQITFNHDKTYSIENYLPFLVRKDGAWNIDDPQYPFHVIFTEEGNSTPLISAMDYKIVNGKRQMSLSFSPGCQSNIYTYVLERVSN